MALEPSQSDQPDLALCDTQSLVDELRGRFPGVLVVTCRPVEHGSPQDDERAVYYGGGASKAVFLAAWAQHLLLAALADAAVRG